MDKTSPIGFFDSGVGGLSVLSSFKKTLREEDTLYFGDLKNLPYGNKTQEQLVGYARNILDFFAKKDVKAVVIACNTSSALAYEKIKNDYSFKIYPIIQSCAKVISSMDVKKIGVFATQGTVNSGAYKTEILKYNPNIKVKEIACPNWVSLVEGVASVNPVDDVKLHLEEMMMFAPDKIILGCTHYPYLLKILEKFVPREIFIDPAEIFVDYIRKDLEQSSLLNTIGKGSTKFYVSANPQNFVENSKLFYEIKELPLVV